jgi:rod shape-determining protein MreB and related proteins
MIQTPWLDSFTDYIGIDLGSSRLRIWGKQGGLVVDDVSAVAIDTQLEKVIAVGQAAAEMFGRVGPHISVLFPITPEGIPNPDIVTAMLRAQLQSVFRLGLFFRPVMVVTVHSHLGQPERQALVELFLSVGAREVFLVDEVLAAAIGSGVPIADASGSLFLHAGAGVTEVGMISLGSIVAFRSSEIAGQEITRRLQIFFKEKYGILVGTSRADNLKIQVMGSSRPLTGQLKIIGQDVGSRSPREVLIERSEFADLIDQIVKDYAELTRQLLERVPPELSQDVLEKGMLITGGSGQLTGLAPKLSQALGFPVSVVDQPAKVVINGLEQVVTNIRQFTDSIGYRQMGG